MRNERLLSDVDTTRDILRSTIQAGQPAQSNRQQRASNVKGKRVIEQVESLSYSENIAHVRDVRNENNIPLSQDYAGPTMPSTTSTCNTNDNNGTAHASIFHGM